VKIFTICRRELHAYFASFSAYILTAVFLILSGYFFYSEMVFFILFGGFTLPTGLWQFWFLRMRLVTLLILPLVTTRLFAEEKKLGTIELLWTYPVRDFEIVAGKFLAAWLFFLLMLLPTATNALVFYHFHTFHVGPVLAAYCGLLLLGTSFIACGMLVSSLTDNQVVSTMVTYGILIFFWFLTWNEEAANQTVMRALLGVSLFDRFYNFARGVIDTRDVFFFVLFSAFFVFLTLESLAARKWRGLR